MNSVWLRMKRSNYFANSQLQTKLLVAVGGNREEGDGKIATIKQIRQRVDMIQDRTLPESYQMQWKTTPS